MSIHKEGYKILVVSFIVFVAINLLLQYKLPDYQILRLIVGGTTVLLYLSFLNFFRNPIRKIEVNDNEIIAPADGKIVVIEEVEETEYFKDKRTQISIFMSPFNVHVNRNPISGVVKYVKYHAGKYLVAWHPKSSTENERNTVVIEKNGVEILFRQIAGAAARRIVNYVKPNDQVTQGEEFGFIKFGSRVDVFIPLDTKVQVYLEQKSVGGKTVLATFK